MIYQRDAIIDQKKKNKSAAITFPADGPFFAFIFSFKIYIFEAHPPYITIYWNFLQVHNV